MNLEDLKVKRGDPILPAWQRLLQWAQTFRPIAGGRYVRLSMVPGVGTRITASFTNASYSGYFPVRMASGAVTVGAGTITEDGNGAFSPYVGQQRCDGVKSDGTTGTPPTFPLTGSPSDDLESWIVIQCPVVQSTGMFDPKNPQLMQIAHVNTLTLPSNKLIAQQEIAQIRWSNPNTPAEVFQIVTHNLKHEFVAAVKGGNQGRHFFWGV